jgi:Leucine-rich repeat (LRR) protein
MGILKYLMFSIFLGLFLVPFTSSTKPKFFCSDEDNSDNTCTLSGLFMTTKNPDFTIVSESSETITNFTIVSYKVEVVTTDICNAFPVLKYINLDRISIQYITPDAFKNCTNLRTLNLNENNITDLDANLLSENSKLVELDLSHNPIRQFNMEIFRNLKQLEILRLDNTHLLNLDIRQLVFYTSLRSVSLDCTYLHCEQLEKIIQNNEEIMFKFAYVRCDVYENYDYSERNINDRDWHCLNEEQWEQKVMNTNITDLLLNDKYNVLMNAIKKLDINDDPFNFFDHDNAVKVYFWILITGFLVVLLLSIVAIAAMVLYCKSKYQLHKATAENYQRLQE